MRQSWRQRWHLHPCLVLRQKRHQDLWQFIAATWRNEAKAGQLVFVCLQNLEKCIVSTTCMHEYMYIYIYIYDVKHDVYHVIMYHLYHIISYYVKLQYIISYYTQLHIYIYIYCFKIIYDDKYIHTRVCSSVYRT